MTTSRPLSTAVIGAAMLFSAACVKPKVADERPASTTLHQTLRSNIDVLRAWFDCIECSAGELRDVLEAQPPATAALSATLENGIPTGVQDALKAKWVDSHTRLFPEKTNEEHDRYGEFFAKLYDERSRIRSAIALSEVHTPFATEALRRAACDPGQTQDVRDSAYEALAKRAVTPCKAASE